MENTRGRKKGTPKTGGRVLGSKNKEKESPQAFITNLLAKHREKLQRELETLSGAEFCEKYIELSSLCQNCSI